MKKSYVYAAASIAIWSTLATISKLLLGEMDKYVLLCFSSLFGAVGLFVICLCSKKLPAFKSYRFKDYIRMSAIGLPGVFLYNAFYYEGASRMLASQAFIINYLWPIMSIVFACILLKEKLTARKIIAILMSFLGVFAVAGNDLIHFNSDTVVGILSCVGGAVSYGLFTALNKKSHYDTQVSMTVATAVSFLLSLFVVLLQGNSLSLSPAQIPGIFWDGVFTKAIANLTWALALSSGNTAKIANLAYITPFLSLVWTFFILHEPIQPMSILGLCIIIAGIFIQLRDPKVSAKK